MIAHAVLCIGHEKVPEDAIDKAIAEISEDGIYIVDYDKLKKKFVFIDDNCPAYSMDYLDHPTERYNSMSNDKESWLACKVKFAIVPLYEKILLMPGLVKIMATSFLPLLGITSGTELSLRTYLASSRTYRNYVCRNNMPQRMKELILNLYLPKFIWVVEISTRQGLKDEYAEGLMIFDPTEPKFNNFSSLDIMYYKKLVAYKDENHILQFDDSVPEVRFESFRNNLR